MPEVKLILFDVDGSLKERNEPIRQALSKTIRILQKKGIFCSVATGGSFLWVKSISGFTPNTYMIVEEARITDNIGDDVFRQEFSEQDFIHFKMAFLQNKIEFAVFIDLNNLAYRFFAHNQEIADSIREKYNGFCDDITFIKDEFVNWARRYGCVKITLKTFCELVEPQGLSCHLNEGLYHIVGQGMDKGVAACVMADILKIDHKEIMVVGNDFNDIPMFATEFGIKLAVGNCPKELMEKATDHIKKVNDLDCFLRRNLL